MPMSYVHERYFAALLRKVRRIDDGADGLLKGAPRG